MIAREGRGVLTVSAFASILLLIIFVTLPTAGRAIVKMPLLISILILVLTVFFFRDPNRVVNSQDGIILSPADGKVVSIEDIDDDFVGQGRRVSIFLSIFDIHVNRIPYDGVVKDLKYKSGRFYPAFKSISSRDNERNEICLEGDGINLKLVQIAGVIARRIISHLSIGDIVRKGERFGIIMLGSRVDVVLPRNVEIIVNKGDRVKGGISYIGKLK